MPIDSKNSQYNGQVDNWKKIDDIIDQKNLTDHLITLNPDDDSPENKSRNVAYKERAVFYALTSQTTTGMIGTMFKKAPVITLNASLEYFTKNVDGRGNSIYQQSQIVAKDVIGKSRCGLVTSFPVVEGEISRADIVSGKYVATIQHLTPTRIYNWHTETFGSVSKLTLVTISDQDVTFENYEEKTVDIVREMFLDGGVYKERKWTKSGDTWAAGDEVIPVDAKGGAFDEIPFTFVGAINNDPDVDVPNMLAMANVNIAHFRNSADFEDSVWFAGQAQPWMSNVDQEHIDLMKENNMYSGSRMMLAVPENGQFGFASAPPNPMVRQAMLDKIDMMVGLGARQISPGGVAKTADQTSGEREMLHSPLSLIASNIGDAYTKCIKWAAKYMGVEDDTSEYIPNLDFIDSKATPQELKEIIIGFMGGSVPMADYVRYMQGYGIFDEEKTAEEYAEELEAAASGGAGGTGGEDGIDLSDAKDEDEGEAGVKE